MSRDSAYGAGFYESVSRDLQDIYPQVHSFSATNLKYMKSFYELYPDAGNHQPESGGMVRETEEEMIFRIPWGHHLVIMNHFRNDQKRALFYVRKTLQNTWSRAVLMNFIDSDLYGREGKAISNFKVSLPADQSDLAQEMTRDPYHFDFLTIRENDNEKELKDALMDNLQKFLLELGTGFAFVGREYRLVVGNTEQFLDMLFYNISLHCYVVVEMKIDEFDPRDMGQLSTYVAAVDGILKKEGDQPTIGLLICKTKDNVLAQYAVNTVNRPIGISEYEFSAFSKEVSSSLPTIEEIEAELTSVEEKETKES